MDKEQINELKPGDEVLIRGRFEKIKENGNYSISYLLTTVHDKLYMYKAAVHPSAVIIKSPPKYAPTRLLRKGDRVQVKERNGRCNGKAGEYLREAFCEVAEDEVPNERVRVFHNSSEYRLDPAYLVLVTPAEELVPYYVERQGEKAGGLCYTVRKRGGYVESIFYFGEPRSRDEQQAKAAAEAECARLNEEWRKEENNV